MPIPVNTINAALKWRQLQDYLASAIFSFNKDRPDTPYQNGYLDALRAIQKEMEK